MSAREAWLSAFGLFAIALVVRAVAAQPVVFPKPEDSAYYVGVARNLVEGRGLVADAIWSYQTPPLVFPRPAFEVWLPLPSLIAAIPMAILGPAAVADFGTAFRAAQLTSVLLGALVPVLAWRIAADVAAELGLPVGRARTLGVGSGVVAAVYLPLVFHSVVPDSTIPFTVLALAACLVMTRAAGAPRPVPWRDARLVALGVLIGLAALTRNEAIWLGLAWAIVAWTAPALRAAHRPVAARVAAIAVPAAAALVVFLPWAYRDWLVFGSPVPGQALANALSVNGTDIFAFGDPPTLARYLAQGPAFLIGSRAIGIVHNVVDVLLFLGAPVSVLGLVALPWTGRASALRPLVIVSALTFTVTSLVFPVSTTWGTFLHAAGPVHVLLVVSAVAALDRAIVALGRRRGWTRPVAWLGPAFCAFASIVFSAAYLPIFGAGTAGTARDFAALGAALTAAGRPPATAGPIITDFPIWLAEADGAQGLALPDESPASVVALSRAIPGTRTLVVWGGIASRWPGVLDAREAGSACFHEIALPIPPGSDGSLAKVRAWDIDCP